MINPDQQALSLPLDEPPEPVRIVVPPGFDVGKCRWCRKRILWATMVDQFGETKMRDKGNGVLVPVRNPLDPVPDPKGKLAVMTRGRARSIGPREVLMPDQRYTSHWATCKKAPKTRDRRHWR